MDQWIVYWIWAKTHQTTSGSFALYATLLLVKWNRKDAIKKTHSNNPHPFRIFNATLVWVNQQFHAKAPPKAMWIVLAWFGFIHCFQNIVSIRFVWLNIRTYSAAINAMCNLVSTSHQLNATFIWVKGIICDDSSTSVLISGTVWWALFSSQIDKCWLKWQSIAG